ncbi:hypothetical protein F2Q70_00026824 [Brassica cretica]|uniref:Uncharacterized protein n=1 Tax=Brassica cretica TaxID=69181 RepID=A0A8S9L1V4_BRACR|nr:hypothetical protein F2Q68_00026389 [Brassica cretica]KAF2601294.1 hypothetical protein F2Q70_00026824 [Brassica cretica]
MNIELRHDRDASWLGSELDTSCLGREMEWSPERIRVRRYRRVWIRIPKQIGAHCICAGGRVGGQIDKRFALTDSSRPGLRFDILIGLQER